MDADSPRDGPRKTISFSPLTDEAGTEPAKVAGECREKIGGRGGGALHRLPHLPNDMCQTGDLQLRSSARCDEVREYFHSVYETATGYCSIGAEHMYLQAGALS